MEDACVFDKNKFLEISDINPCFHLHKFLESTNLLNVWLNFLHMNGINFSDIFLEKERERETEKERQGERDRDTERDPRC